MTVPELCPHFRAQRSADQQFAAAGRRVTHQWNRSFPAAQLLVFFSSGAIGRRADAPVRRRGSPVSVVPAALGPGAVDVADGTAPSRSSGRCLLKGRAGTSAGRRYILTGVSQVLTFVLYRTMSNRKVVTTWSPNSGMMMTRAGLQRWWVTSRKQAWVYSG